MEALSKIADMSRQDAPGLCALHDRPMYRPIVTRQLTHLTKPTDHQRGHDGDVADHPSWHSRRNSFFGRSFDITMALVAIAVFLPFLVFAALAIRLSTPGPALFIQSRIGRDGKAFPCLKFRTMVVNSQDVLLDLLARSPEARAEWERDQKLRDDPRVTRLGALLRKSSLDELPQLFNIIFGHMSIVGPRPIIEPEIWRYGSRFTAYCSVRPGLTGLWQVSGRNDLSYDARVRLDARYALRKSMLYDLGICFRTVPAVIASRGVY